MPVQAGEIVADPPRYTAGDIASMEVHHERATSRFEARLGAYVCGGCARAVALGGASELQRSEASRRLFGPEFPARPGASLRRRNHPPAQVHISVSDVQGRSGVVPLSETVAGHFEAQSLAKAPVAEIQGRSGASFALRAPKAPDSQFAGTEQ